MMTTDIGALVAKQMDKEITDPRMTRVTRRGCSSVVWSSPVEHVAGGREVQERRSLTRLKQLSFANY
jgi:hypothetical protein